MTLAAPCETALSERRNTGRCPLQATTEALAVESDLDDGCAASGVGGPALIQGGQEMGRVCRLAPLILPEVQLLQHESSKFRLENRLISKGLFHQWTANRV